MGKLQTIGRWLGIGSRQTRSIENPNISLDSDEAYEAFGAEESAAGIRVGHERALKLSAVWRGVFLVANTVGKLPLYVYERDADGEGKHYATSHSAYMLLRRKPNPETTAFTFKQVVTAQAILMGNGYAWIDRAGNGSPREIIPLPPGSCHPVRVDGTLYYVYITPSGEPRKLLATDVYHIRGPGLDGLCGINLVHKAKDSLGAGLAAQMYAGKYFANGAEPRVVFEAPAELNPKQRAEIRESWAAMHQGIENSHKSALLEKGVTVKAFGANPEASQLLETRKFSAIDVANWLHLPPHKLGETTRTGYASLEQENQSFLDDAIEPWLVQHEEQCWDKLLTEQEKRGDSHTVEFMRLALMRADAAARATFYHNAKLDGWMNDDEIRARENLNPMPDGQGKKFYRPLNMVEVGAEDKDFQKKAWLAVQGGADTAAIAANLVDIKALTAAVGLPVDEGYVEPYLPVAATEDADGEAARAHPEMSRLRASTRQLLVETCRRMVKRLAVHAAKAAKSTESLAEFLAGGIDEHRGVMVETIGPAMEACAAAFGVKPATAAVVDGLLAELRRRVRATDGTAGAIEDALKTTTGDQQ